MYQKIGCAKNRYYIWPFFVCFLTRRRLLTTENADENIMASLDNNQENIEPNDNKHVEVTYKRRHGTDFQIKNRYRVFECLNNKLKMCF